MKLLYCDKCNDVVRLVKKRRQCECGACAGKYLDELNAVCSGETAIMFGFTNSSFHEAIYMVDKLNEATKTLSTDTHVGLKGEQFTAFVIPEPCQTFKRVEKVKEDE